MEWIGLLVLIAGFLVVLKVTHLSSHSRNVITISKGSIATVLDKSLSDRKKEKLMQQNAVQLFKLTFILLVGSFIALAGPALVVHAMEYAGLVRLDDVLALAIDPLVIAATSLLIILAFFIRRRQA